jgi:PhnB protein
MKLNTHLHFNGRCEEAFRYYEQSLGGKIVFIMTYGDSPAAGQTPPALKDQIMHATLDVGDYVLTGADVPAEHFQKPQGFSVLLHLDDDAQANRIFKALAENGAVKLPMQETFWALRFGMLVDQFGIPWMINCAKPA